METPKDRPGELTELVMAAWVTRLERRKEPRPNTAVYNAAYEACYAVLLESEYGEAAPQRRSCFPGQRRERLS